MTRPGATEKSCPPLHPQHADVDDVSLPVGSPLKLKKVIVIPVLSDKEVGALSIPAESSQGQVWYLLSFFQCYMCCVLWRLCVRALSLVINTFPMNYEECTIMTVWTFFLL
jgi:hypothetical protein